MRRSVTVPGRSRPTPELHRHRAGDADQPSLLTEPETPSDESALTDYRSGEYGRSAQPGAYNHERCVLGWEGSLDADPEPLPPRAPRASSVRVTKPPNDLFG